MDAQRASILLSQTFERVCQDQEKFASSVYKLFFDGAPDAKALFQHTDWEQQQRMLIAVLTLVVKNLNNHTLFNTTMRNLGQRHVRYGAKVEHFATFSRAVLESIRNQLDTDWNAEIEEAWNFAFQRIEQIMIEAGVKSRDAVLLSLK